MNWKRKNTQRERRRRRKRELEVIKSAKKENQNETDRKRRVMRKEWRIGWSLSSSFNFSNHRWSHERVFGSKASNGMWASTIRIKFQKIWTNLQIWRDGYCWFWVYEKNPEFGFWLKCWWEENWLINLNNGVVSYCHAFEYGAYRWRFLTERRFLLQRVLWKWMDRIIIT